MGMGRSAMMTAVFGLRAGEDRCSPWMEEKRKETADMCVFVARSADASTEGVVE